MGVVDVKVSFGQLDISKEKNLLVWALGRHCAPENPFNTGVYLKKKHDELFFPSLIFRAKVP